MIAWQPKIIESPMDSEALALKKGQAMLTIEGFIPLVLALPTVIEPSPWFIQKGTLVVLTIQGFDPLILPKPIQGISRVLAHKL